MPAAAWLTRTKAERSTAESIKKTRWTTQDDFESMAAGVTCQPEMPLASIAQI